MKNEQTRTNKRPLSLYSSHAAHLCSAQTLLCIPTRTYFYANLYQNRTKTQFSPKERTRTKITTLSCNIGNLLTGGGHVPHQSNKESVPEYKFYHFEKSILWVNISKFKSSLPNILLHAPVM